MRFKPRTRIQLLYFSDGDMAILCSHTLPPVMVVRYSKDAMATISGEKIQQIFT